MNREVSSATSVDRIMYYCGIDEPSSIVNPLTRIRRSSPTTLINITDVHTEHNRTYEYFENDDENVCNSVFFILDFFNAYYIPFIILLGFVGNILSCVVFLGTHLKMRSSSYYLAALATADLGFLVALLHVWLNYSIGWRVFNKSGWCEMWVYVSAVCSSLSVWLIVAFTVERFIAVQYPLHRPHMCTVTRAKTIVFVLAVLALTSHSYAFVTAGAVVSPDGIEICALRNDYWKAMKIISIVDSIASLIAPTIFIVVMNTMITRNLLEFSRKFRCSPGTSSQCNSRDKSDINLNQIPSGSSSNNPVEDIPMGNIGGRKPPSQQSFQTTKDNNNAHHSRQHQPMNVTPVSSTPRNGKQIPELTARCIHVGPSSRNLVSTKNQQSITKMLLLISTVFIILNLPSYVVRLCIFFFTLAEKDTPALLACIQQFTMILYYTNFSVNFLLYAMCGITFRRCLDQLLRKTMKNITRYLERERRDSENS